jgi:hypothetical protein
LIFSLRMSASARRPACGQQRADGLGHEIIGLRHDGGDDDLPGRQPERQFAGVVLDHDADEPLEGAQDRAVQHHRAVLFAVRADVGRVQPFGQVEVGLERAALPFAADRVGQLEVELRPVERAFAGVELVLVADRRIAFSSALRPCPRSRRTPRVSGRVESLMSKLAKPASR